MRLYRKWKGHLKQSIFCRPSPLFLILENIHMENIFSMNDLYFNYSQTHHVHQILARMCEGWKWNMLTRNRTFLRPNSPQWIAVKVVRCTSRGKWMTNSSLTLALPRLCLSCSQLIETVWVCPPLMSVHPHLCAFILSCLSVLESARCCLRPQRHQVALPQTHRHTHAYPSPRSNTLFTPHTPGTKGRADLSPPHSESTTVEELLWICCWLSLFYDIWIQALSQLHSKKKIDMWMLQH